MEIKFVRTNENAIAPHRAHPSDAGMDLSVASKVARPEMGGVQYYSGIAVEIPEGHMGLLFARSSICKTNHSVANAVGVIDSGFRKEISLMCRNLDMPGTGYEIGDRFCQLVIIPIPELEYTEVKELSDSDRGKDNEGYGSSGR